MFIAQTSVLGGAVGDRNCLLLPGSSVAVSKDICGLSVSIFIMVLEGADCGSLISFTRNHPCLIDLASHTATRLCLVLLFLLNTDSICIPMS